MQGVGKTMSLQLDFLSGEPPSSDPDDTWDVVLAGYGWTVAFMHDGNLHDMMGGGAHKITSVHQWARLPRIEPQEGAA